MVARGSEPRWRSTSRRRMSASRPGRKKPLRLACRLALQRADLGDDAGAAHQQVVQMGVDLVDLSAQIVERGVGGRHDWKSVDMSGTSDSRSARKSKENIDRFSSKYLAIANGLTETSGDLRRQSMTALPRPARRCPRRPAGTARHRSAPSGRCGSIAASSSARSRSPIRPTARSTASAPTPSWSATRSPATSSPPSRTRSPASPAGGRPWSAPACRSTPTATS